MITNTPPGLMDLLTKKMTYLNQAQTVHAQNVANDSTPNYQPLEAAPFTFGDAMKQAAVTMAVTDPHHLTAVSMAQSNPVAVRAKGKNAADAADVEQESTKVAQTGIEYQLVSTVFHKIRNLFTIALKGSA